MTLLNEFIHHFTPNICELASEKSKMITTLRWRHEYSTSTYKYSWNCQVDFHIFVIRFGEPESTAMIKFNKTIEIIPKEGKINHIICCIRFRTGKYEERCFKGQGPEGEEKLRTYWNVCILIAFVESVRHLAICVIKMLMPLRVNITSAY